MRNLRSFRGRKIRFGEKLKLFAWLVVQKIVFSQFVSSKIRSKSMSIFGATLGQKLILKPHLKILYPWNLKIGDDCWIGEDVWFINHEKVIIGSNVCISQRSIICSGGHDYRSTYLDFKHKPIEIKDGAWVCLDAKVLPGVTIGECSVISAGEVVRKSVPDYSLLLGGQILPIEPPK